MNKTSGVPIAILTPLLFTLGVFAEAHADQKKSPDIPTWTLFVPPESARENCEIKTILDAAGGASLLMEAKMSARFGAYPQAPRIIVYPQDRYRVAAWVKADKNFKSEPGTPGVVLRATLFRPSTEETYDVLIGFKGVAIKDPHPLAGGNFSAQWTKLEGVIEIPPEYDRMIPFVFCWKGAGKFWIKDLVVEKVPRSTPLTPILR